MRLLLAIWALFLGGCGVFSRFDQAPNAQGTVKQLQISDQDIIQSWRAVFLERTRPMAYVGVQTEDVMDANGQSAMKLTKILDGALKDTSLKPGDLVYRINGKPASQQALKSMTQSMRPGQKMTWAYRRPEPSAGKVDLLPKPAGLALPKPAGLALPKPAGLALPKPVGLALPKPAGLALPKPVGLALPKPLGLALPKPAGPVLPKPAGLALQTIEFKLVNGLTYQGPRLLNIDTPKLNQFEPWLAHQNPKAYINSRQLRKEPSPLRIRIQDEIAHLDGNQSSDLSSAFESIQRYLPRAFEDKARSQLLAPMHWAFQHPERLFTFAGELEAPWWHMPKIANEALASSLSRYVSERVFESDKYIARTIDEKRCSYPYRPMDRKAAWLISRRLSDKKGNDYPYQESDTLLALHYALDPSIRYFQLTTAFELIRMSLDLSKGDIFHPLFAYLMGDEKTYVKCEPPAGSVQGKYQACYQCAIGWIVIGGEGDNRYDMSRLAVVIDPGGNDEYVFESVAVRTLHRDRDRDMDRCGAGRLQWILDRAGNDLYRLETEDPNAVGGPASGLGRVAGIVDQAGNDKYIGGRGSLGSGILGVGVIMDMKGDDQYQAPAVTQGFGMHGLGMLIDLDGRDQYLAGALAQGVGSSAGVGLLLDQMGHDFYQCNGQYPSVYGMNGLFFGMGQGVGFGPRPHDAGGMGLLLDGEGNDRYEGGEFTQGGGYFYGVGMLHDKKGNDYYSGGRYCQAWSAHGGIGLLTDDAGNDTYIGQVAANQGAAWDESMSLFLDRAGNDVYQGGWLSMGAASMQSLAYFLDLGGQDVYRPAGKSSVMGESGGDSYHYKESNQLSFSIFMDAGDEQDLVPKFRRGKTAYMTGVANELKPEDSTFWGLYLNRSEAFKTKGKADYPPASPSAATRRLLQNP